MKYADKFPDMNPVFDECDGIIRTTRNVVCCVCGAPTEFIELNYEDSFCSEECVAEMDRRASEATLQSERTSAMWVIEAVDMALEKYDAENIDVVQNEFGRLDIIFHSDKNSFVIQHGVSDYACTDEEFLVKALDARNVGHCW